MVKEKEKDKKDRLLKADFDSVNDSPFLTDRKKRQERKRIKKQMSKTTRKKNKVTVRDV